MNFNLNGCVWVKLNTRGIEILEERHKELYRYHPNTPPFRLPQIDVNGYTRYQLWDLMQNFGEHICMGLPLPFAPTIELEEPKS